MNVWLAIYLIFLTFVSGTNMAFGHHLNEVTDTAPMVEVPQGPYLRGSLSGHGRSDEKPQVEIFLDSYLIDQYEVTNGQYLNFLAQTGHREPLNVFGEGPLSDQDGIADLPVVQVTWNDAEDYCDWAGKRLPTEAEWEKGARGSDGRKFPWGNDEPTSQRVNFDRAWEDGAALLKVGSLSEGVSPYGAFDMSGNVREWVKDWYSEDYYKSSPAKNPSGPSHGMLKVVRGGSWHSMDSDIRVAARGKGGFALKTHGLGFRCAKDAASSTETKP